MLHNCPVPISWDMIGPSLSDPKQRWSLVGGERWVWSSGYLQNLGTRPNQAAFGAADDQHESQRIGQVRPSRDYLGHPLPASPGRYLMKCMAGGASSGMSHLP